MIIPFAEIQTQDYTAELGYHVTQNLNTSHVSIIATSLLAEALVLFDFVGTFTPPTLLMLLFLYMLYLKTTSYPHWHDIQPYHYASLADLGAIQTLLTCGRAG